MAYDQTRRTIAGVGGKENQTQQTIDSWVVDPNTHVPVKFEDPRIQRCWSCLKKRALNFLPLFSVNFGSPACSWMVMEQILQELPTTHKQNSSQYDAK